MNRALVKSSLKKTPYKLWKSKKPNISYFKVFGCKCFIHNNKKDQLAKFDAKSDEGIFLGYFDHSRAYRIFNKRTLVVKESIHIIFRETNQTLPSRDVIDDFLIGTENFIPEPTEKK